MVEEVRHKGLALVVLAAAQFMVILDLTIVNVALPAIQSSLQFKGESELQWVITAYALAFGGFLLLGGRLADLYGRRRIFMAGAGIFALASLACGLAQSPTQMVVFRGLQGFGGALLSPAALSLVLAIFPQGPERNRALGVWSMVAAGGGAVGLLLGGALTQYVDWRWIFFINVPVGALVMAASRVYVPASLPSTRTPLDAIGAITVTGSLMSLVYALAEAADVGWTAKSTVIALAVSAVLIGAFIINEMRVRQPLMPLGIFRRRNVAGGNLIQLLLPAAMFGLFFYLSIYLQLIQQYSPTKTGAANLPFALTIMLVAGFLSRRVGRFNPKTLLTVGPLLAAAGLLYFSRLPIRADYLTDILPGIILMATGMAIVFVTNSIATTDGTPMHETGLISGLLNTGQQIGGAIGLAVLTVISSAVTKTELADLLRDGASSAIGPAGALPQALVHGFQHGFRVAALFALAGSVVALTVFKVHKHPAAPAQEPTAARSPQAGVPLPTQTE